MNAMAHNVTSPVSILVIEHASYSLPWLEREASGQSSDGQVSSDLVVVSQLASEPPSVFATRVLRRVARLAAAATPVSRAVLSCGPRSDEASLGARARIAQVLLSAAQASPSANLTLAAAPGASDRLRHELLAIAGTLLEQSRAPSVNISVQLGEGTASRRDAFTQGSEISKKVA